MDERSRDACPICGQHRLALLAFPDIGAVGYQALSDVIGMGDAKASSQPAIGCLGCGAEWRDVADFREAIDRTRRGESPGS